MGAKAKARRAVLVAWTGVVVGWAAAVLSEVLVIYDLRTRALLIAVTTLAALGLGIYAAERIRARRRRQLITVDDLRRR